MANKQYTVQLNKALKEGSDVAKILKHPYVGTEHILAGMTCVSCVAADVLESHEITQKAIIQKMGGIVGDRMENTGSRTRLPYTPRAKEVLRLSRDEADLCNSELIGTEHVLMAIIREGMSSAVRLLASIEPDLYRLYMDVIYAIGEDMEKFKPLIKSLRDGTEIREAGTPTLDKYSRDLTALSAAHALDPVIGRETEMNRIVQILSRRTKNNPCLVGEAGVGKTAIIEGMAWLITSGQVPANLQGKRLVSLDMAVMVAGTKYRGEFEERISNILREVKEAGNVILFIDELHTIIGTGGAEGSLDASNILKPALARGEIQLIGSTTLEEYRKYIEKDAALERRFQPVTVEEPNEAETIHILEGLAPQFEAYHGITISQDAIEAAVRLSKRYINDRFLPDKAIDVLDEAAAKLNMAHVVVDKKQEQNQAELEALETQRVDAIEAEDFEALPQLQAQLEQLRARIKRHEERNGKKKVTLPVLTEVEVAQMIAQWTKIPVSRLEQSESQRLAHLEELLHKRVVGQQEAVSAVSRAVRRGRVGIMNPNRPIGSFLFMGPTGVGKTELSKALAEAVFGSEDAIIRVDMSEYMESHSVSKMIGSPPGYVGFDEGGQLSEQVRRHPYSVVLFDEVEKAHPDVFNVLLQVLDDGQITDTHGRKISFKNTIIIMTSNIGAKRIIEPKKLGFAEVETNNDAYEKMKAGVLEETKQTFKPEFINRIDELIVFHPLQQEDILQIVTIMTDALSKRAKQQVGITLKVSAQAKELLAKESYDAKFGARPLRRAIQTKIEDALATGMLSGKFASGDTVLVSGAGGKINLVK